MSYLSSPLWLLLLMVSTVEMLSFSPPASLGLESVLPLMVSHAATWCAGPGHHAPAFWSQAACRSDPAGRCSGHPCPWRHRSGDQERAGGSDILYPDGADRDAAAQLVCVHHPDGHGDRLECRRPAPIAPCRWAWWPPSSRRTPLIGAVAAFVILAAMRRWISTGSCRCWPGCGCPFRWWCCSSSPLLGRVAREDRFFLVPSETRGSKVLDRAHALATAHAGSVRPIRSDWCWRIPRVRELHLALLNGRTAAAGRSVAGVERCGNGRAAATPPASAATTGPCFCRIPTALKALL